MKRMSSNTTLALARTSHPSSSSSGEASNGTPRKTQKRHQHQHQHPHQHPQPQLTNNCANNSHPNPNPNAFVTNNINPSSPLQSPSPLPSYHEALTQLQKYDAVCREQAMQLAYFSSQIADLKTIYTYEVAQNHFLLNSVAEKDHLLEYERSRVAYLQQTLLSMHHQQQQQQHPEDNTIAIANSNPNQNQNRCIAHRNRNPISTLWRPPQNVNVQCPTPDEGNANGGGRKEDLNHNKPAESAATSQSSRANTSSSCFSSISGSIVENIGYNYNFPHLFSSNVPIPTSTSLSSLRADDEHISHTESDSMSVSLSTSSFPGGLTFANVNANNVLVSTREINASSSTMQVSNVENVEEEHESDTEIDVVGFSSCSPTPIQCENSGSVSSAITVILTPTSTSALASSSCTSSSISENPIENSINIACTPSQNDWEVKMDTDMIKTTGLGINCDDPVKISKKIKKELQIQVYEEVLKNNNNNDDDQSRSNTNINIVNVYEEENSPTEENRDRKVNKKIPVVEIEPLLFSDCGTSLSYSPKRMPVPSSNFDIDIDLKKLKWKSFDHSAVDCINEKGVPHPSGYAIVKVDLIQQVSLRYPSPNKPNNTNANANVSGTSSATTTGSTSSKKVTKQGKITSVNYVARVKEEAFLEDGQKVFSVDYLKMNKQTCWTSADKNQKEKKICTYTFTAYNGDYGRSYLCFQQDVVVYLPEPKQDRRGKISFANFQFEPYNLHYL